MSSGNNPTARQDAENANLPEEDQYPQPGPPVPSVDTVELDLFSEYPTDLDTAYTLLRCHRPQWVSLEDAQQFFGRLRSAAVDSGCPWRAEGAIFRTARFWCKKVVL